MGRTTIVEGNSNDKDNVRLLIVKGEKGENNTLTIGEVTTAEDTASASITGQSPNQVLNLGLPKGDPNTLTIGTVTRGENASATITGQSPNQTLNLVLPKGDKGDKGDTGDVNADELYYNSYNIINLSNYELIVGYIEKSNNNTIRVHCIYRPKKRLDRTASTVGVINLSGTVYGVNGQIGQYNQGSDVVDAFQLNNKEGIGMDFDFVVSSQIYGNIVDNSPIIFKINTGNIEVFVEPE